MTREARYHRSARAIVDESHIPGRARLVLDPVDLELLRYTLSHRSRDRCDAPVDEIGALTITWVSVRRCVRPMQIWANRNPPRSMQPPRFRRGSTGLIRGNGTPINSIPRSVIMCVDYRTGSAGRIVQNAAKQLGVHLAFQPRPRVGPVARHRREMNLQRISDFFMGQPGEEFQFHQIGFSVVNRF